MNIKNALVNKFLRLVEENHQEITEKFMNNLINDNDAIALRNVETQYIYEFCDNIYRELSRWIDKNYSKDLIEKYYRKIGQEFCDMGIPQSHVYRAMILIKRHLWLFVMAKLDDDIIAYKEALELNNRVVLYFDRATLYLLKGYEDIISNKMF